jgi:hypothetical protein
MPTMPYPTLISFYGPKSPDFARLIGECQREAAAILGQQFQPYDPRQVHCTIAALDRAGEDGMVNASFVEFRGRRVEMDLAGLLVFFRGGDWSDIDIQIGGFADGPAPFTSRGQSPYHRSFTMQAGKAVVMGWPIDRSASVPAYPDRLESLRRGLQRFGILHRYHAKEADIDNDFYLRIGLYDPAAVAPSLAAKVERRLRDFLSHRPPLILPLRLADLAFAYSDHQTLPPATTVLLPISDPALDVDAVRRLFGWGLP